MIGKFSDLVLNEMQGLGDKIAIVIDDSTDSRKRIFIMDRKTIRPISKNKIIIFDSKNNFTPLFKNYANEQFNGLMGFLKNSMFVNSFEDAKMRLKKEKKYLDMIIDDPTEE